MKRFLVKVCGITRPGDANLALKLGADMIGLIFYRPSPRYITRRLAAEIMSTIPPTARTVGVFVDEPVENVSDIARHLRLDFVQLHGAERLSDILFCRRMGLKTIKGFSIKTKADWNRAAASKADLILVDNRKDDRMGGTGESFDWTIKSPVKISNLMLAGGVNSANLGEAVKKFDPLVIDVNSGVESSPGIKSSAKLREFFKVCNRIKYGC